MNGTDHAPATAQPRRPTRSAPRARDRLLAAALCVSVAAALSWAGPGRAQDELHRFGALMLDQPFPFEARDVAVTEVIRQMSLRARIPMIAAEGVGGRVDVANADGSVRDVLQSLADQGHLLWWFDGAAVQIEPPGSLVSRLIPLRGVALSDLRRQLAALRLEDAAWPIVAADPGPGDHGATRIIRVVGPRGYADAVDQVVAALAAELAPAGPSRLPIVIRGPGRRRSGAALPVQVAPGGWLASPFVPDPAAAPARAPLPAPVPGKEAP